MKAPPFLYKAWAFFKRDFRIAASYRLAFVLNLVYSLFILTLVYFIANMVSPDTAGLEQYGGSFFLFILIGYSFYQYFHMSLVQFSSSVQREQYTGCLEAIVATQTRPEVSILLSSIYGLVANLIHLVLIFVLGVLVFGAQLPMVNLLTAVVAFGLSVGFFVGLGVLSAAFIVVLKKGDPITWIVTNANFVFGGAFFPIEQMPSWMQAVARYVPTTYAMEALRGSLILGQGFGALARPLSVLAIATAITVPFAVWVLGVAVRRAKAEGTLVFY